MNVNERLEDRTFFCRVLKAFHGEIAAESVEFRADVEEIFVHRPIGAELTKERTFLKLIHQAILRRVHAEQRMSHSTLYFSLSASLRAMKS